jgi:hypothetical protein
MSHINDFIKNILLESALDNRIENGILEVNNPEHLMVLADHLFEHGLTEEFVTEVVNNLTLRDGKYPDRQAYNKNGWLVTFPSPDYRNAAIKKGTHYTSDPTHGKGGMHLYYKSKGKQARQAQQAASQVQPGQQPPAQPGQPAPAAEPAPVAPISPAPQAETPPAATPAPQEAPSAQSQKAPDSSGEKSSLPAAGDEKAPPTPSAAADGETPKASDGSAQSVTPPTQTPAPATGPSIVELSKKFAASKNWQSTPYGDWNGTTGEKVAVSGYDGQVVPVNHPDRESLAGFIERNKPQA